MLKTISIRKSLDLSKTNAKLKKCWQAPAFARASIRPSRVQGSPSSSSFSSFVLDLIRGGSVPKCNLGTRGTRHGGQALGKRGSRTRTKDEDEDEGERGDRGRRGTQPRCLIRSLYAS